MPIYLKLCKIEKLSCSDMVQEFFFFATLSSFISSTRHLYSGDTVELERCRSFCSSMKPNAIRGTSTNIYVAELRNARENKKKGRNIRGKERKKWEKISSPSYCRENEATSSDLLIVASRFLRVSSFQLAPRDLRLCIHEHLVLLGRVLEILEIRFRRIESRLVDNGVVNERYLCRHRVTLWPKGRSFITHVDASVDAYQRFYKQGTSSR